MSCISPIYCRCGWSMGASNSSIQLPLSFIRIPCSRRVTNKVDPAHYAPIYTPPGSSLSPVRMLVSASVMEKSTPTCVFSDILDSLLRLRTPNCIFAVLDRQCFSAILASARVAQSIHGPLQSVAFPPKQVIGMCSKSSPVLISKRLHD